MKDTISLLNYLPTKNTFSGTKVDSPIVLIHFSPLKRGQPLYTVDKLTGLNVSFIRRSHCIQVLSPVPM